MFKNVWFKVNSEEHAEAVQKMLFTFGVKWCNQDDFVKYLNSMKNYYGGVSEIGLFCGPTSLDIELFDEIDVSWLDPALYRDEEPDETVTIPKKEYEEMDRQIKQHHDFVKWIQDISKNDPETQKFIKEMF
jgi:hypothetical protein